MANRFLALRPFFNFHRRGDQKDIYIFSTPRSGSTFLMEVLQAQPRTKIFDEPLNLHYSVVRDELGISDWGDLTAMDNREEVYKAYFDKLASNRVPGWNSFPLSKNGRLFTSRNVFKIIHGGEDMLDWFQDSFDCHVVILVRHPIPTAQSHKQLPRLPHYLEQPALAALFTEDQQKLIRDVIDNGSWFDQSIINWCIQNTPLLRPHQAARPVLLNYEDLTMSPDRSIAYITEHLNLAPVGDAASLTSRASGSTIQSDPETKKFFEEGGADKDREFLVTKWMFRTSEEDHRRCFELLEAMGIDMYEYGNAYPRDAYRIPGCLASDGHLPAAEPSPETAGSQG